MTNNHVTSFSLSQQLKGAGVSQEGREWYWHKLKRGWTLRNYQSFGCETAAALTLYELVVELGLDKSEPEYSGDDVTPEYLSWQKAMDDLITAAEYGLTPESLGRLLLEGLKQK